VKYLPFVAYVATIWLANWAISTFGLVPVGLGLLAADFTVYTPIKERSWLGAVTLSNTVGLVIDSVLFLLLAFGSLDFLAGQIVGKLWMTVLAVALLAVWKGRHASRFAI
jgi:uncharacterized PurR-regulated membrane protein YhhQ (DUF165 family)